jgi:hypothetical protein
LDPGLHVGDHARAAVLRAVLRVTLWDAFAMAITALIGRLFGAVV